LSSPPLFSFTIFQPETQHYTITLFASLKTFCARRFGLCGKNLVLAQRIRAVLGKWYSVFPFGSVLTMIPFAFLRRSELSKICPALLSRAVGKRDFRFFMVNCSPL
jgi:hypothetical protein